MTGDDILAAWAVLRRPLEERVGADWAAGVPGLEFSAASVLAHAAEAPLWYSVDLFTTREEDVAHRVTVDAEAGPARILGSVAAGAHLLAAVVTAAPVNQRGFHPFGSPDPSGFAAMACDELLVHGDDAARALGFHLEVPADLAARVLARLYPWHDAGADPWQTLLWANGRIELAGRPFQQGWRWHPMPLTEWDGTAPSAAGGPSQS